MTAPDNLYQLVEKFERDQSRFQQPDYNEAQLRQEFVNPFFAALGWDVGDSKQVLHEAGLRSGGSVKHPDYSFLAGSRRAFYVETKKPSINIGNSVDPAEQLRSYGWSGNTALGILTNFAEFAVYDCRIEPKQGDFPAEARIMYLTHSQYLDQWERLQETLSPEAVRQGRHSDLLQATAKGVLRVDEAFLRDMESWRVDLAPDIYKQARFIDRQLSQREINHLVQRTIDRIVFLRIAEDRNLESYGRLERAASVRRNSYNEIKTLYLAADRKYNSGLFHFDPNDKSRPDADTLSLDIRIGDGILRKIIADLYPPKSRYQFSVISADILGQVYERFLGKVIEVRSDGIETAVTVEEKPDVRKAGGVYYTPGYIVDYIVENTVGALVKGKTPDEAAELRVLDPACGSGSFLTGAYQYLLDWHLSQYRSNPRRWTNRIRHSKDGIILRIEEKRRILLNNIYGVDLDQNAVEVSKLSLLLKMLESEHDTLDIEEPLLPDLSGNIKWGNSLIGSDFFSGQDMADLDDEELLRVKPFDWASTPGFGAIMAAGGFDAVIGNPPYVDIKGLPDEDVRYIFDKYPSSNNRVNLFAAFIEQMFYLLKRDTFRYSMIVPTALLTQSSYKALRKKVVSNYSIVKLARLPNESFGNAAGHVKVDTVIFVFSSPDTIQNETEIICYVGYDRITSIDPATASIHSHLRQQIWQAEEDCVWSLSISKEDIQILHKCESYAQPLSTLVEFCLGLTPYDKYKGHTQQQIKNKVFHADFKKDETFKPLLAGNDVKRYVVSWNNEKWISYGSWLGAPREKRFFVEERILVKQIIDWTSKRIWATITTDELYNTQNAFNLLNASDHSLRYILGVLNSRLLTYYHLQEIP